MHWANVTGIISCETLGRRIAAMLFVQTTPTSSRVTLQLATQLDREDANISYLTSSGVGPHLPPVSSLRWNMSQQPTLRSAVPATRLRYLCPPLPAMQLPTAAAHKNTTSLDNHFTSRDILANKKWKKRRSCKVAARDTPA